MRPPNRQCEFFLVRYMPDPVKGEFVNVGVALYTLDNVGPQFCDVLFTRNWSRARCLDPGLDSEEIECLGQQIREAIWNSDRGTIEALRESLGGAVQLTDPRGVRTESPEQELRLLQDTLLHAHRPNSRDHSSAREIIVDSMRREFQKEGILSFMRAGERMARYTEEGDPLTIDYVYAKEARAPTDERIVKMFQGVTLHRDLSHAKALAFSCPRIADGVRALEKSELQLIVIVEAEPPETREVAFAQRVMRESGIRIHSVADLPFLAAQAREDLI